MFGTPISKITILHYGKHDEGKKAPVNKSMRGAVGVEVLRSCILVECNKGWYWPCSNFNCLCRVTVSQTQSRCRREGGGGGGKESKFCGKLSLEGVAWAIELPFISAKGYFCNGESTDRSSTAQHGSLDGHSLFFKFNTNTRTMVFKVGITQLLQILGIMIICNLLCMWSWQRYQ